MTRVKLGCFRRGRRDRIQQVELFNCSAARWLEESSVLTNLEQSREHSLRIRSIFYLLRVFVRRRPME